MIYTCDFMQMDSETFLTLLYDNMKIYLNMQFMICTGICWGLFCCVHRFLGVRVINFTHIHLYYFSGAGTEASSSSSGNEVDLMYMGKWHQHHTTIKQEAWE